MQKMAFKNRFTKRTTSGSWVGLSRKCLILKRSSVGQRCVSS